MRVAPLFYCPKIGHGAHDLHALRDAAPRGRQALEKHRSIALCHDSRVEDQHHPRVVVTPHEPPNPCLMRTTASGRESSLNGFPPRSSMAVMRARSTGSEGTRNGKTAQDDHLQRLSGSVHTLPEGIGSKKHAGALRPKGVQQPCPVVIALFQEPNPCPRQLGVRGSGNVPKKAVGGEQDEPGPGWPAASSSRSGRETPCGRVNRGPGRPSARPGGPAPGS